MSDDNIVYDENEGFLGRALDAVVETVADVVSAVWNGIRNAVRTLFGSYEDLYGGAFDTPDEAELKRRAEAADAIRGVLGEDPIEALRSASTDNEREEAIAALIDGISASLGIKPPPTLAIKRVRGGKKNGYMGCYSFSDHGITLNKAYTHCHPMGANDAAELIDTILHELYHAFQAAALEAPERFGLTEAQAAVWRRNLENYVDSVQNPELYRSQPIEATAWDFAAAVVQSL